MIQINFEKKGTGAGDVKGILRIDNKLIFFQYNNNQYAQQAMAQMQAKGAIITPGRKWIRVNMFGDLEEVKLGNNEFNVKKISGEELELILRDFFLENYSKSGFLCEVKEVKE
ncbi:MAG: hypothetical protein ACOC5T_05340 [Elusimicrobiota bacterium]